MNSVTHLSPIFDWYREDFGKTDQAILGFVAPHFDGGAEPPAFNLVGAEDPFHPVRGVPQHPETAADTVTFAASE